MRELFPAGAVIGEAKVFGGEPGSVNLVAKGPVRVLVPRGSNERLVGKIVYQGPLRPPVAAGAQVGPAADPARRRAGARHAALRRRGRRSRADCTKRAFDAASELVIGFVRSRFSKSGS